MPAFSYKDWAGRQAKPVRRLVNRLGEAIHEVGDVVLVRDYDARMRFSVSNLARDNKTFLWGVEPQDIELVDQSGRFMKGKIFRYLIQQNAFESAWIKPADVAASIKEDERLVTYLLRLMFQERMILRRTEGSGWVYRPRHRQVLDEMTVLDKLLSSQDFLSQ